MGICWLFWWPLWKGGGLIGGDLYPYFFPQKTYLAENLRAGRIPLWNSLVGFGYPVLGESQTAALYPPNLLLFSVFEVNTAYNISQLGHYLFAFIGAYCLARRWRLRMAGALLTALVFVYGWFPARICLEWAIIGGAWFVWILWSATAFLQTGQHKYLLLTALFLGLDLLAGHYNLAFITLLVLLAFPWLVPREDLIAGVPITAMDHETMAGNSFSRHARWQRGLWLVVAAGLGFMLAGIQLLPTWELKTLSQRNAVSDVFIPTYGHLPLQAISQLWMPWAWYAGQRTMDEQLIECQFLAVPAATNQAEAQLYLGLFPLLMCVLGLVLPGLRRNSSLRHPWGWVLLAVVSLVFATGWPTYLLPGMPGLNFFRGPGRYSMVAAWTIGLLAGAGLDALLHWRNWGQRSQGVVITLLFTLTTGDLWAASRQYDFGILPYFGRKVFYSVMLNGSPMNDLHEGTLYQYFQAEGDRCRVYAPGANLATILGVSALPVYLGIGPEIYESKEIRADFTTTDGEEITEIVQRLRHFGVTHLLLESPIDVLKWPVVFQGKRMDRLMNGALGRTDPFYLYVLQDSPGRVQIENLLPSEHHQSESETAETPGDVADNRIRRFIVEANRVQVDVECRSDCRLILRDLIYPGWKLRQPHQQMLYDQLFRSVELRAENSVNEIQTVEWVYRPASVFYGGVLSLLGLAGLTVAAVWRSGKERKGRTAG